MPSSQLISTLAVKEEPVLPRFERDDLADIVPWWCNCYTCCIKMIWTVNTCARCPLRWNTFAIQGKFLPLDCCLVGEDMKSAALLVKVRAKPDPSCRSGGVVPWEQWPHFCMPIETIPLRVWFVPQVLDFFLVSSLRRTQDSSKKWDSIFIYTRSWTVPSVTYGSLLGNLLKACLGSLKMVPFEGEWLVGAGLHSSRFSHLRSTFRWRCLAGSSLVHWLWGGWE